MKPLICKCCGASMKRKQTICEYCGAHYDHPVSIVKFEAVEDDTITIRCSVNIPLEYKRMYPDNVDEFVKNEMAMQIAEQIKDILANSMLIRVDPINLTDTYTSALKIKVPR